MEEAIQFATNILGFLFSGFCAFVHVYVAKKKRVSILKQFDLIVVPKKPMSFQSSPLDEISFICGDKLWNSDVFLRQLYNCSYYNVTTIIK